MGSSEASLRGQLLLASPSLVDPNFHRTVVLVAEHSEEGALGLVINRAAEATVGEAAPELTWIATAEEPVFVGGPVAPTAAIILAEFDDPEAAALVITGDLGLAPASPELDAVGEAIRRSRLFAGHAGWGPGQLEAELEEDSWIIEPAARDDVFTHEPGELWAAVLRRKGGQYGLLATMPPDPSMN